MAKNRSAMKRAAISEVRAARNTAQRSAMKTAIKKFEEAPAGDKATLDSTFLKATRLVDKAVSNGILHSNARDRKKAQLAKAFNSKANAPATV